MLACFRVINEYERAVVFRLGRSSSENEKGPGLFFYIPCIDSITVIDLRTVTFDVPPRNSSEFKGKLKIGNNSAAEFDTKFIKIVELLTKSFKNLLSGIRFRKEFGNVDKFSIEFGCRIITNFEFPFKFGRIAIFILNVIFCVQLRE